MRRFPCIHPASWVFVLQLAVAALVIISPEGLFEGAQEKEAWEQAARQIKRLPPSAFKELPAPIVKQLESQGCTIPQTAEIPKLHNVIRGEFARRGQMDWAVLCSTDGTSSIQVFWGKSAACPSRFAAGEDLHSLQGLGDLGIGYSRAIESVGKDYIMEHYKAYGGPEPPPILHQGINDIFLGKASGVFYCHRGKWMTLQGAD